MYRIMPPYNKEPAAAIGKETFMLRGLLVMRTGGLMKRRTIYLYNRGIR